MRRVARRIFRAPVAAVVILAVVVVGAVLDHDDAAPAQATAPVVATSTSTTSASIPITTTPTSTTWTTTAMIVDGDDDPAAIDGRTWNWDQLADCESGSWGANQVPHRGTANWAAVRAIYQGGLQFAAGTWDHYKDAGFPADAQTASREQQIVVAEKVFAAQGPRAWPTCAPRLGMVGPDLPVDDPVVPAIPLAEPLAP